MESIHVPRENEPGPYYGHPAVYIGPCGVPAGRSWAVYVADGDAHDRHTLKALTDTESQAEAIAGDVIRVSFGCHSARFRAAFGWPELKQTPVNKRLNRKSFGFREGR